MSYATGRDAASARLVSKPSPEIQFLIPSCCFMEAFTTLESERKRHNRLIGGLESEQRQAARNLMSPHTRSLADHLGQSISASLAAFDDFETRLIAVIEMLARSAVLIELSPDLILKSIRFDLIEDPTDNLILTAILDHAGQHGSDQKALLTENRRCFGDNPDVKFALGEAEIKYFAKAAKFLQWHGAKPEV